MNLKRAFASVVIPKSKSRNQIPIWMEFNQLALKYGALNLCHGTPSLTLPDFLIKNMQDVVAEGINNNYTTFAGHPLLRESIAKHFSPFF
jgi:aspartate/methionine/tyrosine aminotransferase